MRRNRSIKTEAAAKHVKQDNLKSVCDQTRAFLSNRTVLTTGETEHKPNKS